MKIIDVTKENLASEHICCAISKESDPQIVSKKRWLLAMFEKGLKFKKSDERGKCFIQYIPAENAWSPINAKNYIHIDCLWVSGRLAKNGYSRILLEECIRDCKNQNKYGITIISSDKKRVFLSDPKYLAHMGFKIADDAPPYFKLMYLPINSNAKIPRFSDCVKKQNRGEKGFVIYCSHACPFNAKYIPILENTAKEKRAPLKTVKFENEKQAQNSPSPFTIFSLFYNGEFITHEILSPAKFEKILSQNGF